MTPTTEPSLPTVPVFPFEQPKKKILMICDSPLTLSGVGVQARMLIEGLLSTGKYKFVCFGAAIKHQNYETQVVNPDFIVRPLDSFGNKQQLRQALLTEKPDAVFIFTDPRQYIWLWEKEDEIHQVCPLVYWHVWDNDPYPDFNDVWYKSTDLINCLSWKTYELVKPHHPEKTNYIPHAWPRNVYHRLPAEHIEKVRKELFGDKSDWFKVLWVNRNAHRKMGNDLLAAWKGFLDELQVKYGHRKALLFMHTNPKDPEGFDLEATANLLGLSGNLLFQPSFWDFPQMNALYNAVDCSVNISKAEGFGLNVLTSLQVGRLVVANKTGGLTRQVIDHRDGTIYGSAVDPATRSLMGSVHLVPYIYDDYVNVKDVTKGLMDIYEMPKEKREMLEQKAMDYVRTEFNYNKVIYDWDKTLSSCIEEFAVRSNATAKVKRFELASLAYVPKQQQPKQLAPLSFSKFMPGNVAGKTTELSAILAQAGSGPATEEKNKSDILTAPAAFQS